MTMVSNILVILVVVLAMRRHPGAEGLGEVGQRHVTEAADQEGLGFGEGACQRAVDRLLDEAAGVGEGEAHGHQPGGAEGVVDIAQRNGLEGTGQFPAAAMALCGADEAGFAQPGHGAADDDGVGAHHLRQLGRGQRAAVIGHVQERMENGGEAIVLFHATLNVT
jgi:hypothetical protein